MLIGNLSMINEEEYLAYRGGEKRDWVGWMTIFHGVCLLLEILCILLCFPKPSSTARGRTQGSSVRSLWGKEKLLLLSCWHKSGARPTVGRSPSHACLGRGLCEGASLKRRWKACSFPLSPNGHSGEIVAQSIQLLACSKWKISVLQFKADYKVTICFKIRGRDYAADSHASFPCGLQWAKCTLILGTTCNLNTKSKLSEVFLASTAPYQFHACTCFVALFTK